MFLWQLTFFGMSLFLTTSYAASFKGIDSIIKIPDECKGQHLCTIKPQGYHHLEANIDSWLPKYLVKFPVPKIDVQLRSGEDMKHDQNCLEKKESGPSYTYFYNETNPYDYEILVQNERFTQNIEVVKCGKLQEPMTANSNEQCFKKLGISTYKLKSSCETIWTVRPLFVFNKDGTGIIKKHLKVPVACSCIVSNLFSEIKIVPHGKI